MSKKIRDFIYVDKDRLNSLYSQVYEGVIEAVIESYNSELANSKESKSAIKGQTLETQVAELSSKTENKILYDHMYNALEDKLADIIFDVNAHECVKTENLKDKTIIKVSGKASIQDYNLLKLYMEKFNDLGKIIAYSNYTSLPQSTQKTTNVNELAKKLGLVQDKTMLANIKTITEFFNDDGFDIMISSSNSPDILYRGIIDKDYLRISPQLLRTLYGDEPPMDFTLVGQVTYYPQDTVITGDEEPTEETQSETSSISDAYNNMFKSYKAVEKIFFEGKQKQRIHIAPIAVYIENTHD